MRGGPSPARAVVSACSLSLALAGCGEDPVDAPNDTIVFDMVVNVGPGEEVHACQFVKMPEGGGELFVSGGEYDTTAGTHHFLVFRTDPEMPAPALNEPVDCYEGDGAMRWERGYVTGGQLEHEAADFPAGLALPFEPGAILLMQSHVVNPSPEPIDAKVHVELRTIPPSEVQARVGTFRFYDPFIHVPAGGAGTASMRCHIHHPVNLLSAGSHMHSRGIEYRAYADGPGAAASAPFFSTTDWQHPEPWTGLMTLPAGSALRFECDYQNTSDFDVVQGPSAVDDEMCMLSGFYYPAQDAHEEDCASMDMHGTGTRSCAQTTSCLSLCDPAEAPRFDERSAEVGPCFQRCIVDSCPNVTEKLFPQLLCTKDRCAEACEAYDAACSACVVEHCKAELDACQALSCGS